MPDPIIENLQFEGNNFQQSELEKGVYEECRFISCNFSESNLKKYVFIDCIFEKCNLSNSILTKTSFQGCEFRSCKMVGVRFDHCTPLLLSFSFDSCMLNLSSFYGLKIPGTNFMKCNLQEADFTGCSLVGSNFQHTDLYRAIFHNTILEECDLRSAENYSIDPEENSIRRAKFSLEGIPGLLIKYTLQIDGS